MKKRTIKKRIEQSIIAGIIAIAAIFLIGVFDRAVGKYDRLVTVEEINGGITTLEDSNGNTWDYETSEFEVGESVILVLYSTGSGICNDPVLEIKELER